MRPSDYKLTVLAVLWHVILILLSNTICLRATNQKEYITYLGDDSLGRSACYANMKTKVQIFSFHIKSWKWLHRLVTLVFREVETGEFLDLLTTSWAPALMENPVSKIKQSGKERGGYSNFSSHVHIYTHTFTYTYMCTYTTYLHVMRYTMKKLQRHASWAMAQLYLHFHHLLLHNANVKDNSNNKNVYCNISGSIVLEQSPEGLRPLFSPLWHLSEDNQCTCIMCVPTM